MYRKEPFSGWWSEKLNSEWFPTNRRSLSLLLSLFFFRYIEHSFAVNQFWLILTFWPLKNMIDFLDSSSIEKNTTKTHNVNFRTFNDNHWHTLVEMLSFFRFVRMERIGFALISQDVKYIHIHVVSFEAICNILNSISLFFVWLVSISMSKQ